MSIKAPTPPKAPVAPTMPTAEDGGTTPVVESETSGHSITSGELHTPAEKFGVHIKLSGSEAFANTNAVENGTESNESIESSKEYTEGLKEESIEGQTQKQTPKQTQAKKQMPKQDNISKSAISPKKESDDTTSKDGANTADKVIQYLGGGSDTEELTSQEGSLKIAPQDDSLWGNLANGNTSYWPFLLIFMVALATFILMNFMKKRPKDDDFGSFRYKNFEDESSQPLATKLNNYQVDSYKEASQQVIPRQTTVKAKKDEHGHFEVRI